VALATLLVADARVQDMHARAVAAEAELEAVLARDAMREAQK
jgi:hypothetical protein